MRQSVQAAGVPWYRPEDYDRLRNQVFADGHLLPPTYDAWHRKAEQVLKELAAQGIVAVKAQIHPEEFVVWCQVRGLHVDGKARMQFANTVAITKYRETN